jgi:hypothetical protein
MSTFRGSQESELTTRRPHAGLLRRERRALLEAREEELRRLGGLMVEMYRRNDYRDDLLADVCAAVIGIDSRVEEIGAVLADRRRPAQCPCGTPILHGSHYCSNCGSTVAQTAPAPAPAHALQPAFA